MGNVKALSWVSNAVGNSLQVVCQNHKQGVRRGGPGGEIVVPIVYDKVKPLDLTLYQVYEGKNFGLFSTRTNSLILPIQYHEVEFETKTLDFIGNKGFCRLDKDAHSVVQEVLYDRVVKTESPFEYLVRKDGKHGVVKSYKPSEPVIPIEFDWIEVVTIKDISNRYLHVLYLVRKNGKFGLLDTLGVDSYEHLFGTEGVEYDEIRQVDNDQFLLRQGTKCNLYMHWWGCTVFSEDQDEIKRVAKGQYLIRKGNSFRLFTIDNLSHPLSEEYDELRRMVDGTFWFRKGDQTGIYSPNAPSAVELDKDD